MISSKDMVINHHDLRKFAGWHLLTLKMITCLPLFV